MIDNEIIKALECCQNGRNFEECKECDYVECLTDKGCLGELLTDALDLINRQKAEIERLQKAGEEAVSCFNRMESLYNIKCMELKVAKNQAITEFADRLCEDRVSNDPVVIAVKTELKMMKEGVGE